MTCEPGESLSDVMERNQEPYDFLPVVEDACGDKGHILGLFHAAPFFRTGSPVGYVEDYFTSLSEKFLIGADTSILEFVRDAHTKPCRLVVSGPKIIGLVGLSDLQKLPVRAALFALITGFEIAMAEAIRVKFDDPEDWMAHLTDGRKDKIAEEIRKSHRDDNYVDSLLFTQFCDKAVIIEKAFNLKVSKTKLRAQLGEIQDLRDKLAHANAYAATLQHAKNLCAVVRNLLSLKNGLHGKK